MDNRQLLPGVGRAHGKVILLGEHTVVYGTPALALPVPALPVTVSARSGSGPLMRPFDGRHGPGIHLRRHIAGAAGSSGSEVAVAAALHEWGLPEADIDLAVQCTVPPGRGLGASAACATASVRAVAELYDVPLDPGSLYRLVQCGEQVTHGRASGIDAWATMSRHPIRFQSGMVRPLEIGFDADLVIADSGVASSTKPAVEAVRARLDADPQAARQLIKRATAIVEAAVADLGSADPRALGQRFNAFQVVLDELGASTVALNGLISAARDAGAAGAKLTGGGLGGCIVALAEHSSTADVAEALKRAGAVQTWIVSLPGDGS